MSRFETRALGAGHVRLWAGGTGPTLLYLHGFDRHPGDAPFLNRLAHTHHVLAPEHPGYGETTPAHPLHDITDQTLHYRRAVEAWATGPVDVIGHSLGGMFAAEFAALCPHLTRRLILVDTYGLWNDATPLPDPFTLPPAALKSAQYANPANAPTTPPTPGDLAAATRYLWPIPDRGLSRRLPFIQAPTLILHGTQDGLIPPAYAQTLATQIPNARVQLIPNAGHYPMTEAEDLFIGAISAFLAN